jgi:hypothetical protein
MADAFYERLMEVKERKFRLNKAERRQPELVKRKREQERRIAQLETQLEAEKRDVDKLTRMSLTNLFFTILQSKEEQLEVERQQALAAALKLQEAKQLLTLIEVEMVRNGGELAACQSAEREYEQVMAEKEEALRHTPSAFGELAEMEANIADQSVHAKELNEALTAGRRVMLSLEDAATCLGKAENWGKWDMWGGGGMISTHIKHSHIDDARDFIHQANHQMRSFHDELADLKRNVEIEIDISGMLKMADYWFDGFITDWIVQGRVRNAEEQTLEALQRVRTIVMQLQKEHAASESALANMKTKRVDWIENTSLS